MKKKENRGGRNGKNDYIGVSGGHYPVSLIFYHCLLIETA